MKIRKITTVVEDTLIEAGREAREPLRKVAVTAICGNPCAGRYVEDLSKLIEGSVAIGRRISELAASHIHSPIWACMDAGNLAAFPVLNGLESLTVFADNDGSGAGQRAAAEVADRWLDAGREVLIVTADSINTDIADEALAWQGK